MVKPLSGLPSSQIRTAASRESRNDPAPRSVGTRWISTIFGLAAQYGRDLQTRSRRLVRLLSRHLGSLAGTWLVLVALMGAFRIAISPTPPTDLVSLAELTLPYLLIAAAPLAGFVIGRDAFKGRSRRRRSSYHLSAIGGWKILSQREAMRHPSFGPTGFMASLLVGLLISIAVRTTEFAIALPALTSEAPSWSVTLFWLVAADTIVMNFFYMVCFVMALRTVPLFPKMMLFVWLADLLMQLTVAQVVSAHAIPSPVAQSLARLLTGNVTTVLISMAIWLPYLIFAERVNVTYRQRVSVR